VGNTVRVHATIKEGDKERIQIFEGVITRYAKGANRSTITVRKISFGVGVERVFPLHSPTIDHVEHISTGHVRRARLYYLRNKKGKEARLETELGGHADPMDAMGPVASGPVVSNSKDEKKAHVSEVVTAQKV